MIAAAARKVVRRLRRAQEGVAMVEFAYSLVVIVPLFMGGVELGNYVTTKMRVSQLALHVADNGSRIGIDSLLAKPRITEGQINDLLIGANLQSGDLDLAAKGRVIISSVEPMDNPVTANRYRIRWQRCYGAKVWPSSYGGVSTNLTAVGPAGEQVTAPTGGGVIFVEIAYTYEPLFVSSDLISNPNIRETAAMVVRDDRDFTGNSGTGVYPTTGVTASTC
jgi:Flp pilus assembly pilin Flp